MSDSPRIVFILMSAVSRPETVDQLARSLAPHTVLVHHDFSQTAEFHLFSPNVTFVPNPKRTGWAVWGFTAGIFHSLQHAVDHVEFDYVQLLSPSCLPIKPMKQFEAHVSSGDSDAHFGAVDLLGQREALMTVGYRAFTPDGTFRHRVLRRLARLYFRDSEDRWDVAGIQLRSGERTNRRGQLSIIARIAHLVTTIYSHPRIGQHIFDANLRPYYGSTWFGARRHVVEQVLQRYNQPDIQRYFPRLRIADEFLIPTLLKHTGAKAGPANHFVNTFHEANPAWFDDEDFPRLQLSPAFFARKFRDDPSVPIRHRVLTELAGVRTLDAEPIS